MVRSFAITDVYIEHPYDMLIVYIKSQMTKQWQHQNTQINSTS